MFFKYYKYLCPSLSKFVHVFASLVQVLSKFLSYNIPLIPWRFRLPPIVIAVSAVIAVLSYCSSYIIINILFLFLYNILLLLFCITVICITSISVLLILLLLYILLLRYRYIDITVIQSMI